MKTKSITLLVLICLLIGSPAWGRKTFKNPILTGMNPDPSICRVGDDYYLITSTFEYFPGFPIYQSKDLVHWKQIGHVLSRASNNPLMRTGSSGGQFAATIRYHKGRFYVIGTNYASGGEFYVSAENPAGPWSEPVWLKMWYVDPSLLFADDLVYYVSPDNKGSFLVGTMELETGTFDKPVKLVAAGLGGSAPEGPHLYKINDYYYLMSAEGGTGYEHREVIQRSKSPFGPFEPSPNNPVVSNMNDSGNPFQAIGHADLMQLPDKSWWLVCLGIRPRNGKYQHLGRETFLAPVTWSEDGWPKVGGDGAMKKEYPVPNLPEHIWEKKPVRDNFKGRDLDFVWNFLRNPHDADWSLSEKPGHLRLNGSGINFEQKDSPAFVCRRQTAFDMVASTKLDFTPTVPNEEAGLVIRGNDENHYDFVISMRAGKRVALLRKFLQGRVAELRYKEIPDGDVVLRISSTDREYQFWAQKEGETAALLGTASTKDLSTERIGGFTGVFIGLFASGNGTANANPADFDWFDFEENPKLPHAWARGAQPTQNGMGTPVIRSAVSPSFDTVRLAWDAVRNADDYRIERYAGDQYEKVGSVKSGAMTFVDSGLKGGSTYVYRVIAGNRHGASIPSIGVSATTLNAPGPSSGKRGAAFVEDLHIEKRESE